MALKIDIIINFVLKEKFLSSFNERLKLVGTCISCIEPQF